MRIGPPLHQPNTQLSRLAEVGHAMLAPGRWLVEEIEALWREATGPAPKWGNIFNESPPPDPKFSDSIHKGMSMIFFEK